MDKLTREQINYVFLQEVLRVRDMLEPVLTGEIERGHCVAGKREAYGATPGKRKTTLADARNIVRHATAAINRAVREFEDAEREDETCS